MEPVPSQPLTGCRYRFGPFEFRSDELDLRRKGVRVPVARQSLQILAVFLGRPDTVVTRDQLREALWAGDLHLDFDGALNTAMKRLRQALEDTAAKERYIETVPRVGYRFVAPVEAIRPEIAVEPETIAVPETPAAQARPRRSNKILFPIGAGVLLGIAGIFIWHTFEPARPLSILNRTILTSFPGEQIEPALSPDGGQIAFSWANPQAGGLSSIYVTSAGGLGLHRLTQNNVDRAPAWSPDGSQIAFIREVPNRYADIYVVPSAGGAERRVSGTNGRSVAWLPGGHEIVVAQKIAGARDFRLLAFNLQSGERRRLTSDSERVDGWDPFAYSPDGSMVGYAAWTGTQGSAEVFVRPAFGGPALQITHFGILLRGWCWMPDGKSILVTDNSSGTRRIVRIPVKPSPGLPEPLPALGDDVIDPAVVGVGSDVRVAYAQQHLTSNLYQLSIRRDSAGGPIALEAPHVIAPATRQTSNPQISQDGRRIVFLSDRTLFSELWVSLADGSDAHPITSFASSRRVPGSPRWSPDASKIAFTVSEEGLEDLFIAPADGGPIVQLTHHQFDVIRPSWSHDGKSIYFSRRQNSESQLTLWKMPVRGGASEKDATPIMGLSGLEPIESPEGGTLYYIPKLDSEEVWSVPLAGGTPTKVIGSGVVRGWWVPVPGGIYYVKLFADDRVTQMEHAPVLYFDNKSRTSRVIGELSGQPYSRQIGLAVLGDKLWTDWVDLSSVNLVRADLKP